MQWGIAYGAGAWGFQQGVAYVSTLLDDALKLLLDEIRTRLKYLCDVGIGYLTLSTRQRLSTQLTRGAGSAVQAPAGALARCTSSYRMLYSIALA